MLATEHSSDLVEAAKIATTATQKTKELGHSVNESVLKPTKDKVSEGKILDDVSASVSSLATKVKDGSLMNDVGSSMSGFASKLSAASSKGWTGLQSLWGEPKTTLATADTSPGEKTSLLGMGGYGSGAAGDSSGNRLLSEEEDSWGDSWGGEWGQDGSGSGSGSGNNLSSTKPPAKQSRGPAASSEWSAGNDDDLEAWLNEDSPYRGMLNKDKAPAPKKAPKDAKRPSSGSKNRSASSKGDEWKDVEWDSGFTSPGKQKEPLVGNLLDLGGEEAATSSGHKADSGWDNEVWADEDEDEWHTLDLDSGPSSKGKKSS